MGLVALMPVQSVLADTSDLANLRYAVESARITLDETTQRMNLLVAELDAESVDVMPVEDGAPVSESEVQAEEQVQLPEVEPVSGTVQRALFTSGIEGREPVDELQQVDSSRAQLVFFSELVGFEGQEIWHRWVYQDEVMAEVVFQVGGARWRVHSSKNLMPEWIGAWRVEVVDSNGHVLASQSLEVVSSMMNEEPVPDNP